MYMNILHNVVDIFITMLNDALIANYKLAWRRMKQRTWKVT